MCIEGPTKIQSKGRRPLACYHEAGHALARWYFGHSCDRAVVLTAEEVRAGKKVENGRGVLVQCEGLLDGYDILGWPFGPMRINASPEHNEYFNKLRMVSRDIELIHCMSGPYAEAIYTRKSVHDRIFLGGSGDIAHIIMILEAWGLNQNESAKLRTEAEKRASALLRSQMGSAAIRAVAEALLEHGEVEGDEINRLCRNAYGDRQCPYDAWSTCWPPTLEQLRTGYIPPCPP